MNEIPEHFKVLMMKQIDGEISPAEARELEAWLAENPGFRRELDTLKTIKEKTQAMKTHHLPELAWDDYWTVLYNRLERGFAWVLVSVGAILVSAYGLWEVFSGLTTDTNMPMPLRIGLFTLLLGGLVLLFSVLREKILMRKYDKYKEIKR